MSAFDAVRRNPILWLGAALMAGALALSALVVVPETKQAVVIRFGQPVRIMNAYDPREAFGRTGAGLAAKIPFFEHLVWVDKRVLDLDMPRVNGFDFLAWLNERPEYKIIPVIVMSGSGLEQDVKKAYELGANQYMVKPIDWQQFRERLHLIGVVWNEHTETPRMQ